MNDNLVGTRVYDKINECEATVVEVADQCGSAVLILEDAEGMWAQWPRNVVEVKRPTAALRAACERLSGLGIRPETATMMQYEQVLDEFAREGNEHGRWYVDASDEEWQAFREGVEKVQMDEQQMQQRYDEINAELRQLEAQWCSENHGGLERDEYGRRDAELVAERNELRRRFAAVRVQTTACGA